jgi:hypothetical protein
MVKSDFAIVETDADCSFSVLSTITEWAERKASELRKTRAQVMALVEDVSLSSYAWPGG